MTPFFKGKFSVLSFVVLIFFYHETLLAQYNPFPSYQSSFQQRVLTILSGEDEAKTTLLSATTILNEISQDNGCDQWGGSMPFLREFIAAHLATISMIASTFPDLSSTAIQSLNSYVQNLRNCPRDRAFAYRNLELIPEQGLDSYTPSEKLDPRSLDPAVLNILPQMPPLHLF
ncbi:MAG: hypothetical protein ACXVCY_13410 [Pseudobdellovibrionaceae bacterium]